MLRALVLVLVLANALYLVWTQGLLAVYGFAPASQAEPERLAQQIRPEAMQLQEVKLVRPPAQAPQNTTATPVVPVAPAIVASAAPVRPVAPMAAASAAPATPAAVLPTLPGLPAVSAAATANKAALPIVASAPPAPSAPPVPVALPAVRLVAQCLQTGLFTEYQANAMRPRLQARLPAGSWSFESTGEPVRWMVYMGRYVNKAAMNKKRALLEQVGVPFETPISPQLNPGLSLGSYKTRAEADVALVRLAARGIRSARVVQERPDMPTQRLRLPSVDAAQQARFSSFILQLSGQPLQACR